MWSPLPIQRGILRQCFDSPKPRRRSIRLPGHDYANPGIYFVTVCVQDRRCLFGDIVIVNCATTTPATWSCFGGKSYRRNFFRLSWTLLFSCPNHFHGILHLTNRGAVAGRPHGAAPTLGTMIAWFKSMTTNEYVRGVRNHNWPPFEARLWQRNYYEHIVRGEPGLESIRDYIMANPDKWDTDPENPAARNRRKQS